MASEKQSPWLLRSRTPRPALQGVPSYRREARKLPTLELVSVYSLWRNTIITRFYFINSSTTTSMGRNVHSPIFSFENKKAREQFALAEANLDAARLNLRQHQESGERPASARKSRKGRKRMRRKRWRAWNCNWRSRNL